jgi:putative SOS response-associated peptidase YedK
MCGRYSFAIEDDLILQRFGIRVRTAIYKANYNCSPTQTLAVITNEAPDTLNFFRWGLVPSWAKDRTIGNKLINARAETLTEKPSFRSAFRDKRCLIPATGFYEWKHVQKEGMKTKAAIPFQIGLKNGDAFCFAGLWDQWVSGDGEILRSFTIITTSPNELVREIHDRMPVILRRDDEQRWISPGPDPSLVELLKPFPEDLMESQQVAKLKISESPSLFTGPP